MYTNVMLPLTLVSNKLNVTFFTTLFQWDYNCNCFQAFRVSVGVEALLNDAITVLAYKLENSIWSQSLHLQSQMFIHCSK